MSVTIPASDIQHQQRVADYRTVRKTVRSSGYGSIFFGLLATVMGALSISVNPINGLLLLLGVILLVTGVVNAINPTPTGIIVDGVTLLLVGGWNIFITIANAAEQSGSSGSSGHAPVLAIFQIIYGIASFSRYKRFANAYAVHPSANELREMDELLKAIWKAKPKDTPDVIQFAAITSNRNNQWKAKLLPDRAIFVMAGGHDVTFVSKENATVASTGKVVLGKALKAEFQIADKMLKGTISPDDLDRFTAWKTGHYEPRLVRV